MIHCFLITLQHSVERIAWWKDDKHVNGPTLYQHKEIYDDIVLWLDTQQQPNRFKARSQVYMGPQ
jgi:hypothetical protein